MGIRLSPERWPFGIRVVAVGEHAEILHAKVDEALATIAAAHPRRLERIRRDLPLILVRRHAASQAVYDSARKMCILDSAFLLMPGTSPLVIAASIVHEATHARIHRWGVRYEGPNRVRIERLCRKVELEFGLRLVDGDVVVHRARSFLEGPDDVLAPSVDAWQRALQRAVVVEVDELPLPRLVKKWLVRLRAHVAV